VANEAVGHAWQHMPKDWTSSTKLVALAMADVVNDMNGWRFWSSVRTLAKKTGVSPRTVRESLRTLEEAGWLDRVEERPGETYVYEWTPAKTAAPPADLAAPPRKILPVPPAKTAGGTPAKTAANSQEKQLLDELQEAQQQQPCATPEPDPATIAAAARLDLPPVITEAIGLLVKIRARRSPPDNPVPWARAMHGRLAVEHGPTLLAHLEEHPTASVVDLAAACGFSRYDAAELLESA